MRAFIFASGDFLRANLRGIGGILLWVLGLTLTLLSLTALWGFPPHQPAGPASSQRLFLLQLNPLLSEQDINRLAWQIWAWPEVWSVSFRFPGESEPEPVGERTLVVEPRPGGNLEGLATHFEKIPGVTNVAVLERTVLPAQVPSVARIGAIAGLLGGLSLSLLLGIRVLGQARRRWQKERDLLRHSGASPLIWRGPEVFLALVAGLLSAGLHLAALILGTKFIPADTAWAQLLPMVPWAIGIGFPVGGVLALLAVVLSPHS